MVTIVIKIPLVVSETRACEQRNKCFSVGV